MKKYLNKQVLLSIVSLLILISCEKEEENEPVRSGEFMTVSINVNLLEIISNSFKNTHLNIL